MSDLAIFHRPVGRGAPDRIEYWLINRQMVIAVRGNGELRFPYGGKDVSNIGETLINALDGVSDWERLL